MSNDDISYYKSYYDRMGANAYLGENMAHTSRMLVFCEWLRAELKPGARVLDIGVGDGIFTELMPEFEWYGQDINIDKAHRIPKERLAEHDSMKAPYPWDTGFFDCVVTSEHLEHLWDLRVVHKEAKRLLTRKGLYVISTPNFDWITNHLEHFRRIMQDRDNHWAWEHIRHFNFESHQKFLNDSGFVVEKHAGADAHYCPVFHNATVAIQAGLREQGVEINPHLIHKWIGIGVPHYQHTVVISSRKA